MSTPLRIVAFVAFPPAYQLVAAWAAQHGHTIVLVVTPPASGPNRYGEENPALISSLPPEQNVLITGRLKTTAAAAIAKLAPDLIVSATFPRRIPEEVTAIPRLGAVNLHPAPLPRGRGPNPQRLIYDGDLTAGATLHRIAPGFDTGAILSRHERPLPTAVTPEIIISAWFDLLSAALEEGTARAIAGEPGDPQDESQASAATFFTPAEKVLTWNEPSLTIQRRAAALNLMAPVARADIDGQHVLVRDVLALADAPTAFPGDILDRTGDILIVRTADTAVQVAISPIPIPS